MLSLYLFYDNLGLLYSKRNACMHIMLSSIVGDVSVFCNFSPYNIFKESILNVMLSAYFHLWQKP